MTHFKIETIFFFSSIPLLRRRVKRNALPSGELIQKTHPGTARCTMQGHMSKFFGNKLDLVSLAFPFDAFKRKPTSIYVLYAFEIHCQVVVKSC